ncbi:SDR family oxidoreductase [Streptomyces sp. NPDC047009]|uniref:SDR family NAD(P)-dependent oxidoreductase n=1 Tax=Streptomyces sp. NPDC047009 TaxID=3154496 RepID=UPI00340804F7
MTVHSAAQRPVAIVTGASRGIGAACAIRLAAQGCRVAVNYARSRSAADEVVHRIRSNGGEAVAVRADVSRLGSATALADEVADLLGPPLVVVNNAGVQRSRAMIRQDPEALEEMLTTNVHGSWAVTRAALPHMYEVGWGRVVFMSSVLGATGGPGDTGYSASKAALLGMSKSLAFEVARRGITSNAVLPGTILTDLATEVDAAVLDANIASLAARRGGEPDEVAAVVAFLCSAEASYVNGAEIAVHGGGWVNLPPTT